LPVFDVYYCILYIIVASCTFHDVAFLIKAKSRWKLLKTVVLTVITKHLRQSLWLKKLSKTRNTMCVLCSYSNLLFYANLYIRPIARHSGGGSMRGAEGCGMWGGALCPSTENFGTLSLEMGLLVQLSFYTLT